MVKGRRNANRHRTNPDTAHFLQQAARGVQLVKHNMGALGQDEAHFGGTHAAASTIEQARSGDMLKPANRFAEGGLGDTQLNGGLRDAAKSAGELGVRLAIPLAMCLLPAFALAGVVPLIIAVVVGADLGSLDLGDVDTNVSVPGP